MSSRRVTLRTVLKVGLAAVSVTAAVAAGAGAWWWSTADTDTAGRVTFANRLAIPPLAPATRDQAGRRVFDLRLGHGQRQFRPGAPTTTYGVNGPHLGPTLRAARGERVLVRVRNHLGEATTLHWHGMHLPARADGGPHQPIQPGQGWSPTWTVDQPAATLWYHPHPHGRTAGHVARGLAGLFILDDPASAPAGLPRRYGIDDVPLIIQDLHLGRDNQIDQGKGGEGPAGVLGDLVTVNGTIAPYHQVTTEQVRLRLLNASSARTYQLGLEDDRPFALIATDGGLLAAPHQTSRVQLSPGERAEIVLAMRPGERTVLRSHEPELGTNPFVARLSGGHDTLDILELRAAPTLAPAPAPPGRLADPPRIDTAAPAATRSFRLSGTKINDQAMDLGRIDAATTLGTTEIWEIASTDGLPHNFHVHDVQFQVLSVAGATPPPHLRGWKDTIQVRPNAPVRIAMRFADYADPHAPYMFHCHLLTHEDQGLMGQFVVVEPGQAAASIPHANHAG